MTKPLLGKLVFVWDLDVWAPAFITRSVVDDNQVAAFILEGSPRIAHVAHCVDQANPLYYEYITEEEFRALDV